MTDSTDYSGKITKTLLVVAKQGFEDQTPINQNSQN
jgi:hypothetical protein